MMLMMMTELSRWFSLKIVTAGNVMSKNKNKKKMMIGWLW